MNNTNKTGGSAFPLFAATGYTGMTLRDYFAAKAMQGLLSDSNVTAKPDVFASYAYEVADAMLRAREEA
jgi:hypothetical protein